MSAGVAETNWSGNYTYRAASLHRPRTVPEVQELVSASARVRALGTRHSFTDVADSDALISLSELEGEVDVDHQHSTVSVPGQVTYAQLAAVLNRERRALHSLASLPHISVAGAISTATHGSGDTYGNLSTAVCGLELVTGSGQLIRVTRGDPDFDGMVVGLGALGIITRVTLETEPYYEVRQRVYDNLPWEALYAHYDDITARGQSVSVFHRFGDYAEQVWVKTRVGGRDLRDEGEDLFGASPADGPRSPMPHGETRNCTEQLGIPGPWSERLPHFRSGFTPSSGAELQSEVFVDRRDALDALDAVRALGPRIEPLLLICELRTIAADQLWMSPQYGRRTSAIHFTWERRQAEVEALVAEIEAALRPFALRSHWGKVSSLRAGQIEADYERLTDFRRLRDRLDPQRRFVNRWLSDRVLGQG